MNLVLRWGLDKRRYHLIKNVTIPTEDGTTQIDHVVVSVYSVFVIEIKELAGHASIQTTMRYLHLDKSERFAEINMAFKKIATILVIFLALGQRLTE